MQIVIDIPKDLFEECKRLGDMNDTLFEAIRKCTILPDKHGRLIDADAIKKKYPLMYNDLGMEFNEGIHGALDEAPTIIEATGGE